MPKKPIPPITREGRVSVIERLKVLGPYTSLVAYAFTPDMTHLVFATPRATQKYKNILNNKNVSLLIDTRSNTARDYLQAEAVTILGTAAAVRRGPKRTEIAKHLTEKHPDLTAFVDTSSTALVRVKIYECYHVSQFQAVTHWTNDRSDQT
jgi:nitroimidazol reductase NimA-like FMN-containing flavoprotein (pyridoxamine 5'-phosphate oxidase superfamily)